MMPVAAGKTRAGLSLLEVLVSVFVLSVGLLGVAAVLPLGQFKINQANKANRAGICGRSAREEIEVRGWLDPEKWLAMNFFGRYPAAAGFSRGDWLPLPINNGPVGATGQPRGIPRKDSFAIDPLFIAANGNWNKSPTAWFPLISVVDPASTPSPNPGLVTALRRVTIDVDPRPGPSFFFPMPLAVADQIFTWHDDQIFSLPEDPQERPRQLALWDNGIGATVPLDPGMTTNNMTVKRLADDNYSWMATVTPLLSESSFRTPPPAPALSFSDTRQIAGYEVSIVVFYKRSFQLPPAVYDPEDPPRERSFYAVMVGGGFSGGDVLLVADASAQANASTWLTVKKGDWLMLRGLDGGPPTGGPSVLDQGRVIAKWYRVVAVSDQLEPSPFPAPVGGLTGRYVTLAGPDWKADRDGDGMFEPVVDRTGNNEFDWAEASLIDDVVGVYTTTVITNQE